ncbi:MAG: hypothetical protein Phog2KO_24520 [Phototrophicaceae bacterium]
MHFRRTIIALLGLSTLVISLRVAPVIAQESTPELTPEVTETACIQVIGAIGPCEYGETINPLTGLEVEDINILNRRPIIVKISNSPALVRPQSGIGEADLVFEHYTEVGITRFSAIFYSNAPTRVGSIRSARLIDYELAPMYDALLAFAGASIGVDKRIYGSDAVAQGLCAPREDYEQCLAEANIIGPAGFVPASDFVERAYKGVLFGAPYFYRDESLPVPHNFFANLEALWELAEADGNGGQQDLSGMAFHPEIQGTPDGSGIYAQVRYTTTVAEWHYDPETALYYRSTDGQVHFDATLNQQVSASNVVIVYAGHYLTDIIESGYADVIHWSEQITVWPEGDAIIMRNGVRYEGQWLRPTRADLLTFETNEGETIYLNTGNTWVQLVRLPEQMNPDNEWVIVE